MPIEFQKKHSMGNAIRELTQAEATQALRSALEDETLFALREDLRNAFGGETKGVLSALPAEQRRYYLICFCGAPYLLVGVNLVPQAIVISSVGKVRLEPRRKSDVCLRSLIESVLVPMCRDKSKGAITARAITGNAVKMLERLRAQPPHATKVRVGSACTYIFELL